MFRYRGSIFACAAVLALTIAIMPIAVSADPTPAGATAPNFTLPSQEGQPVSLADRKGK